MSTPSSDVLDTVLGVEPGDRLDQLRRQRLQARDNAQLAYEAIFVPVEEAEFPVAHRFAVAQLVADLHGFGPLAEYYRARLAETGGDELAGLVSDLADDVGTTGPYGRFKEAGLQGRNTEGLRVELDAAQREALGDKLAAALEHTHAMVYRPRETSPELLERLSAAGWDATGIVTLSQLVAFLAFQIRLAAGLDALRNTWEIAA